MVELKTWKKNIDVSVSSFHDHTKRSDDQWMEIENYLNLLRSEIQELKPKEDDEEIGYKIFKTGQDIKRKMKIKQRRFAMS